MPPVSKVRKYKPEEVDRNRLAARAYEIWHKKPFSWQLDASEAILCGQDVVVDVGTFRLSLQFCCDLLKYLYLLLLLPFSMFPLSLSPLNFAIDKLLGSKNATPLQVWDRCETINDLKAVRVPGRGGGCISPL